MSFLASDDRNLVNNFKTANRHTKKLLPELVSSYIIAAQIKTKPYFIFISHLIFVNNLLAKEMI